MSPRTEQENERIREERRDQILASARKVLAQRGLAATRISDISKEAGISHGLLYHYFASKEEMFTEILERSLQGTLRVTSSAKERPGSPWERIAWMFDYMVQGGRQSPDSVLIAVQASNGIASPPGTRQLMEQYGEPIFGNVVELIREAQESGEVVEGNPVTLAAALLACVQGLAIATVTGGDHPDLLPEPELVLRMLRA